MPSATIHLAGDLSLTDTHSSRFLPSNSTMASEGGAPSAAPGVTTLGTGSHTSVSWGLGAEGCCADRRAMRAADARDSFTGIFIYCLGLSISVHPIASVGGDRLIEFWSSCHPPLGDRGASQGIGRRSCL